LDPYGSNHAIYVTGQGVWMTANLMEEKPEKILWEFVNTGLEETAVLDMTSSVKTALLSAVGDIGGMRHYNLNEAPTGGMYVNPVFGNTTGIDFAGLKPNVVARVGNSREGKFGAFSKDNGTKWKPFWQSPEPGGMEGSIAVSSDGKTFLWAPRGKTPAFSRNQGWSWKACAGLPVDVKPASDRVNPNQFYAYAEGVLYVSTDGGATFHPAAKGMKGKGRARAVFGVEGEVWVACETGLYRSVNSGADVTALKDVSKAYAVGFGAGSVPGKHPAVYLVGVVKGIYGFFRSDNEGASWTRINDDQHQYGWGVEFVAGDEDVYGRVYIGTNGRGILYGEPLGERREEE